MERFSVLGVRVSAVSLAQAADQIEAWIAARERHYVTVTGVHGVMESQRDPALRDIHNAAGMVTPDGMPLVWLGKADGHRHITRVYGPDLMLEVFRRAAAAGHKHFLYGATDDTLARLRAALEARFPGTRIVGTFSPPFRELTADEENDIVAMINASGADLVWVGLSTPKQERWMARYRDRLEAPVLLGVGAAFDFHAGLKKQAPAALQRAGLEWLYRLCQEPRRLGRRYLANNPAFIALILRERLLRRRVG